MKSLTLQIILIIASVLFLLFIINLVRTRKLRLKYALTWLFLGIFFTVIAIFPSLLTLISKILTITEPVNTIFLLTIVFMLIIILSLTLSLSKNSDRVKKLTQEIAILKEKTNNHE